ncbi:MAG: type II toxin-antitoxin system VapC family toxin [Oscillospiraceae bacterium]|nr:type II toxin-antitoxin system VapC family toxin [Oscillospiraceae bacterium]
MLDTNICIYLINSKSTQLAKKIASINHNEVFVSTITQSELEYGVSKSQYTDKNTYALKMFLSTVTVIAYDTKAAEVYGDIRYELERKGETIGAMDMLIASHAKSNGYTLITNNVKEFERVSGLNIENWVDDEESVKGVINSKNDN